MDQVTRYRQILQQVITSVAHELSQGNQARILPVCDPINDQYLLITLGWINGRREHAICFHAQLLGQTVKIEVDLTEEGLTEALIEAGIAPGDFEYDWIPRPRDKAEEAMAA